MKFPKTTQLLKDIKDNPQLASEFQQDPEKALKKYLMENAEENPKEWDVWIYRIVVLALGLTIILIVVGVVIVLLQNIEIKSENLITIIASIGSAAIGALAGLLAPSPRQTSN